MLQQKLHCCNKKWQQIHDNLATELRQIDDKTTEWNFEFFFAIK